jgi:DNA-binding NtrC family response regulator
MATVLAPEQHARRDDSRGLNESLDALERTLIDEALLDTGGNIADAARRLQTDRANLYRRMRRLGMDR